MRTGTGCGPVPRRTDCPPCPFAPLYYFGSLYIKAYSSALGVLPEDLGLSVQNVVASSTSGVHLRLSETPGLRVRNASTADRTWPAAGPDNAEGRPPRRVTALQFKRTYWLYGP
ncbi:hypothetical protein ABZZ79_25055 [Streptomyces sp. NPDC006458]|uniref:hypothetical protein n=1 Tax=Streptomyces sp. NPDC006458 TaxID=3154302 RepID=UPI0033BD5BA5